MTLEQALVVANKNLDKKNLRGFIVYTFHEDGMISSAYSCSIIATLQAAKLLTDIANVEMFPPTS